MKIKTMEPLEQVRDLTANVTNEKKTHPLKRKDQNIEKIVERLLAMKRKRQ